MAAVLRLVVRLWVPVRVVQDHGVRGVQVDAHAARARGQQEGELLATGPVVRVDVVLAHLVRRVAVDAAVLVAAHDHVVL
ncbi:MAG: hypothetical protein RL615_771, partial [Pseudomonadota bacterium]